MLTKEKIAEIVAKTAVKAAKQACGSASLYGLHQAKESADVQKYFISNSK